MLVAVLHKRSNKCSYTFLCRLLRQQGCFMMVHNAGRHFRALAFTLKVNVPLSLFYSRFSYSVPMHHVTSKQGKLKQEFFFCLENILTTFLADSHRLWIPGLVNLQFAVGKIKLSLFFRRRNQDKVRQENIQIILEREQNNLSLFPGPSVTPHANSHSILIRKVEPGQLFWLVSKLVLSLPVVLFLAVCARTPEYSRPRLIGIWFYS